MKKNLFFAAAVALGMSALTACSSSEGKDAANDESVVGATDGMETVEESAAEVESTDAMPGNIIGEVPATTENEEGTAAEGEKSLVDKAKDAVSTGVDKVKEVGKEGVDKVKEVGKEGVDKAKEVGKEGVDKAKNVYEKAKEAVENGADKAKDILKK